MRMRASDHRLCLCTTGTSFQLPMSLCFCPSIALGNCATKSPACKDVDSLQDEQEYILVDVMDQAFTSQFSRRPCLLLAGLIIQGGQHK